MRLILTAYAEHIDTNYAKISQTSSLQFFFFFENLLFQTLTVGLVVGNSPGAGLESLLKLLYQCVNVFIYLFFNN